MPLISFSTPRPKSTRRPVMTRSAPSSANKRAVALPIPEVAPVMIATLCKSLFIVSSLPQDGFCADEEGCYHTRKQFQKDQPMKLEPLQPLQTESYAESRVRSPQHILAGALYGFLIG